MMARQESLRDCGFEVGSCTASCRRPEEHHRSAVVLDTLDIGAEVLAKVAGESDLAELAGAVEHLDKEAKRIVDSTADAVEQSVVKVVAEMTAKNAGRRWTTRPAP